MKRPIAEIIYIPTFIGIVSILFFPLESQADAINPLLNLFTPDTVVPASALTILIIVIEGLLLWKWTKSISFRLSLWRAAVINIISSGAGSIAAWLFFQKQMIWEMAGLYIPMFFLTLVTETPALKYLYRKNNFDWKRSTKVSFGINIISYLFVFIAQFGLVFAYIVYADFADSQTTKKWNDLSLLEGETGYIYTVKYAPSGDFRKHIFNRYDVENKKWETINLRLKRGIDPIAWDVKANLIACIIKTGDWNTRPISVINATTLSKLAQINGDFREVRISPDLSKLAALDYVREINAPRDDESSFMLGSGYKLKIYDIKSSSLLYEAPRLALDGGLTWTSNSTVIFSSLRDESLLQSKEVETHDHTYGRSYAEKEQFPVDLFAYDSRSNSVRSLTEGQYPQFNPSKNKVSFFRVSGFYSRELWQGDKELTNLRLILSDILGNEVAISPSGRKYLISVPHKQPLGNSYFLTVVDPNESEKRFLVEPNSHYGFRWISK